MIGALARLLLIGALIYVAVRAVRALLRSARLSSRQAPTEVDGNAPADQIMVRDPVCGTYVSARDALSLPRQGGTVYFCSDDCRRRYTK